MNNKNDGEVRLMNLREVEKAVSIKKSLIYEQMKAHAFPQNVPVAGTRKAWLSSEIQQYNKGRRDWAPGSESERMLEITDMLGQGIEECHAALSGLFESRH